MVNPDVDDYTKTLNLAEILDGTFLTLIKSA